MPHGLPAEEVPLDTIATAWQPRFSHQAQFPTGPLNIPYIVQHRVADRYAPTVNIAETRSQSQSDNDDDPRATSNWTSWAAKIGLSCFLMMILLGMIFADELYSRDKYPATVFSPARSAQRFQAVTFNGDVGTVNKYKGIPSKSLDNAWQALYEVDPFLVDKGKLSSIGKDSVGVTSREGKGLAKLAVFHQLHCLDYVRKYVHREHYRINDSHATVSAVEHADHCIDILRQALMCSADVTLITFTQNALGEVNPDFDATHACIDFKKIHQWAKGHAINLTEELTRPM